MYYYARKLKFMSREFNLRKKMVIIETKLSSKYQEHQNTGRFHTNKH
jgi:hypothetical protein